MEVPLWTKGDFKSVIKSSIQEGPFCFLSLQPFKKSIPFSPEKNTLLL